MTTRPVRDDVLESVLLGRASDGAPADLRATILAAVAAEKGRAVRRSWPRRHPWRLLAVAAILLTTVGTAILAGPPRKAVDPPPSQLAVVPRPSPTASTTTSSPPPPSTGPQASSDVTSPIGTASGGSCARLQNDAEQAGVTRRPWSVGHKGPGSTVSNGLIAASGGSGPKDLRLIEVATGTSTRIGPSWGDAVSVLGWSPTGTALAFDAVLGVGGPGGCTGLFVRDDAGVVEVAYRRGSYEGVAWSPDGSALAYVVSGPEPDYWPHLTIAAADGSAPKDLGSICTGCGFVDPPAWSPDSAHVAITWMTVDQSDSRLSILDVRTGTWSIVPHSAGDRFADSGFNANGGLGRWLDASTLLIAADVMSPSGHQAYATVAIDKPGMPTTRVAWPPIEVGTISPDLRWVTNLGCGRCTLTVTSRASGHTRTLWDSTSDNVAWSPDSRRLIIATKRSIAKPGMWVIDVDGSGRRRITSTVAQVVDWQPVWP
jgi:dipeptidyl aminopeptidase/acylaminoacyl peptidase